MSHPGHIILRGGAGHETDGEYENGTVEIVWARPEGMSHKQVAHCTKRLLELQDQMYAIMSHMGDESA